MVLEFFILTRQADRYNNCLLALYVCVLRIWLCYIT